MKTSAAPFRLRRLDHVVLRITDLKASLHFYLDVLGCTMERQVEETGFYQVRVGDSLIDLIPVDGKLGSQGGAPPGVEGRNVDHFAIQITPFNESEIRGYLTERGINVGENAERYGAEGFGPSIYLHDPDGNVVELKGPPTR